jgi:hypothetical protein
VLPVGEMVVVAGLTLIELPVARTGAATANALTTSRAAATSSAKRLDAEPPKWMVGLTGSSFSRAR